LIVGARFTSGRGDPNYPDSNTQASVQDDVFHGTMTTGIMVANTNNGRGIAGVAAASRVLVIKALSRAYDSHGNVTGSGDPYDVAAAVDYAVAHGASVINLSLGTDVVVSNTPGLDPLGPAITRAVNAGRAVAVAAGNSGLPVGDYVGRGALVVGALTPEGNVASYSNSPLASTSMPPAATGRAGGRRGMSYRPPSAATQTPRGPRSRPPTWREHSHF
jgi:subtilisin family serine protease